MPRFLVVRPDLIGDAIVTQVVIEALANTLPCEIDIFVSDYSYQFYENNPFVQNIFHCNVEDKKAASDYYKSMCSGIKYDAVFVLQSRRRLQKFSLLNKCKKRVGFDLVFDKRSSTSIFQWTMTTFYQFQYVEYRFDRHEVLNMSAVINGGLATLGLPKLAPLPDQCKLYSPHIIDAVKTPNSIVINISGKPSEQRIVLPSMLMSLLLLLKDKASKLSIIAVSDDITIAEDTIRLIKKEIPSFIEPEIISNKDIFAVANKLNAFEYYIGIDGGVLHIAAALGLKCVGLYNDNKKLLWYPWTPSQVTLSAKLSYTISPVEVVDALDKLGFAKQREPKVIAETIVESQPIIENCIKPMYIAENEELND